VRAEIGCVPGLAERRARCAFFALNPHLRSTQSRRTSLLGPRPYPRRALVPSSCTCSASADSSGRRFRLGGSQASERRHPIPKELLAAPDDLEEALIVVTIPAATLLSLEQAEKAVALDVQVPADYLLAPDKLAQLCESWLVVPIPTNALQDVEVVNKEGCYFFDQHCTWSKAVLVISSRRMLLGLASPRRRQWSPAQMINCMRC
jgi:hypothetical protein